MKIVSNNRRSLVGALVGDIVGSIYEFDNYRAKDFVPFADYHREKCFATDDSIMTLAVCKALMESQDISDLSSQAVRYMQEIGRPYPRCGFGGRFFSWIYSDNPKPYNSFGNGSAMRVSPVAYFANNLEEAELLAEKVTAVTHNHPEGIKGAKVTAGLVYLALCGKSREDLRAYAEKFYDLNFTIDEIRPKYRFNETCMKTVPQAIVAFFESTDFDDALRTAISVGGDSDTLAAITCGIAGAFYGVPDFYYTKALTYLDDRLLSVFREFEGDTCEA